MTVRKYKKGDRLVYPHHGACTVEKIEKMTAFDVKQDYLKLKVAYTDLVLMVPVANAEFLHARLPNNRLDVLDTGHLAWEEASGEYGAIIAAWVNGGYLAGSTGMGRT